MRGKQGGPGGLFGVPEASRYETRATRSQLIMKQRNRLLGEESEMTGWSVSFSPRHEMVRGEVGERARETQTTAARQKTSGERCSACRAACDGGSGKTLQEDTESGKLDWVSRGRVRKGRREDEEEGSDAG